jgi:hypothetical protein
VFEEREVLSLGVWLCVTVFVLWQHHRLRIAIPHYRVIISGFFLLVGSAFCSVIEGIFWNTQLNFLQHLLSGISAVLLAVWCYRIFRSNATAENEP